MPRALRILVFLLAGLLSAATLAVCVVGGVYLYFGPQLPSAGDIGDPELNEPLRVYTSDRKLIGEFGLERRLPRTYDEIPPQMVQAFIAAEDDRFFEHPGVDYQGIARAVYVLATTGRKTQGGSTITMQLARNLYLTRDRTYVRKIKEIILALRLESKLTKEQILEIYLNKIYLGNRSYGVGAASEVYYHKPLDELSVAEVAMIAGLPKAPSRYNPMSNPERAKERRNYVLSRMHALGEIDDATYEKALDAPITATAKVADDRYEADYVAEMVRQDMVARFGDEAYTSGFDVTTTLNSERQRGANRALRRALLAYDERHQWHGPEATLETTTVDDADALKTALEGMNAAGGLVPAVVTNVGRRSATLMTERYGEINLDAGQMPWLGGNDPASKLVARGDVVRLAYTGSKDKAKAWTLAEVPEVQGAMVALDPHTGGIEALAGGFDFSLSKYNRAVQAQRQPGSSFKPFLYSAALANGFTPASLINDAPVVYDSPDLSDAWRPQNYSGRIYGPTRLREGLVHSRNLVSIRLLRSIGINNAVNHIAKFGLPEDQIPRNLSMALGSASFSPLQMAQAYAVFANDGFQVKPYYIAKIEDGRGEVRFEAEPKVACASTSNCAALQRTGGKQDSSRLAERVIDAGNAWLVGDIMRDVIKRGTGRRAMSLGRSDLSGKTGTTNDQIDAWFVGFNADLVGISWVGFDKLTPMGNSETGGQAALPMWIDFMRVALDGTPEAIPRRPADLVTVSIDPESGQRAIGGGGVSETFRPNNVPSLEEARRSGKNAPSNEVEQLF
ncbi:Multimodular transpeptidase-transglycosylase [Salinisphaera dokdonensis CL-ES53]|uniref:Penicillin-binding protein 1A n=2 Tax=Salinisphaera TaxID=180541 RepID=A0ABV2B1H8_9GAMM